MAKRPRPDVRIDRRKWKSLPPVFRAAVDAFDQWSDDHLNAVAARDAITTPLYHYTDEAGLKGIITNQEVWFTDYRQFKRPHRDEIRDGDCRENLARNQRRQSTH
jgi:hypothetical protein